MVLRRSLLCIVVASLCLVGCDLVSPTESTPINAAFSFTILGDGATVVFTNSTPNIGNWNWSFGDGQTSTERSPIHKYNQGGDFQVSLTACSKSNSDCDTVTALVSVWP